MIPFSNVLEIWPHAAIADALLFYAHQCQRRRCQSFQPTLRRLMIAVIIMILLRALHAHLIQRNSQQPIVAALQSPHGLLHRFAQGIDSSRPISLRG
jgi:hypothetical protein